MPRYQIVFQQPRFHLWNFHFHLQTHKLDISSILKIIIKQCFIEEEEKDVGLYFKPKGFDIELRLDESKTLEDYGVEDEDKIEFRRRDELYTPLFKVTLAETIYEGWLSKLNAHKTFGFWGRRWFEIIDNQLLYYTNDKKGNDPRGKISLFGCNFMADIVPKKRRDFCVLIRTSDMEESYLSAFTKSKMEEWKTALLSSILYATQQTIRYLPPLTSDQNTNPYSGGVVYKTGWLIKEKTKGMKGFELRYFVLTEKALHYFIPSPDRELAPQYKRSLQLKTSRLQAEELKKGSKYYLMRLTDTSQDSDLIFGTQDPRNFEQWRTILSSSIESAQKFPGL